MAGWAIRVTEYETRVIMATAEINDTSATATQAPTTSLEALPPAAKRALGALHDAPLEIAQLTLATLGYWTRVLLADEGIVEPFEKVQPGAPEETEVLQAPMELKLTPYGHKVMELCAKELPGETDVSATAERLRTEHEEFLAARSAAV